MITNLPNSKLSPNTRRAQAFKSIGSHTLTAAHVSKLREGNMPHHQQHSHSALTTSTSQADMTKMSQEQQLRIIDNENAIQLMPEIEWACRVLVSSILSPKDMTKRELIYTIDLDWLSPSVKSVILDDVKKEMENVYNYSDSLYYIFKDALFTKGAHPRLILPEAAVDKIINSGQTLTMESLNNVFIKDGSTIKNRGYFGPPGLELKGNKITMESFRRANSIKKPDSPDERFLIEKFKDDKSEETEVVPLDLITITDNPDDIKLPFYLEAVSESRREEMASRPTIDFGDFDFGFGETGNSTNESYQDETAPNSGLTKNEFRNTVYKSAPNNMVTHLRIPGRDSLKRRSVGRPLVQSIPPESVIPLHVPGDVRRKIGYIIIYGDHGHPITLEGSDQVISRAQTMFNTMNTSNTTGKDSMSSMILSKAARNMTGGTQVTTFRDLSKIFEQLVEDNIVPRLMNGAYPGGVEIGDSNDLYTLMVARVLCSMRTRMVFVPAEMMTYFAFDYHSNGMGKSLLDANKMLIAIRAGILLTRMTGELRNAIPLTKVRMKIDEDDTDWEKTWEEALHMISTTRQPQYPLSTLAVNDLMDWIHRAGFQFEFEGHPRMPDTGFAFEKINHQQQLPDQEFYDSLGKQLYMGFGIPPELMDSAYDPEFAIAVASRNIMFTQTILESQKIASGLITDDHRRLILSDGVMMNNIVRLVKSKWGEISIRLPEEDNELLKKDPKRFAIDLVKRIVNSIVVSLPQPDATTLENQRERYDQFTQFIDSALPNFASEDVVSMDIAPELSQKIGSMSNMLKAAITREWMANNNILPELFKMSSVDEEGKPQFDALKILEDHTAGLMANLMGFAKAMAPLDQAVKKDTETLQLGDEVSGGGLGSSGGSDSSGSDSGGDFGGGDFGGDLDMDFGEGSGSDTSEASEPTESGEGEESAPPQG